jgi:eukaryotic-like serine/threonine-protein kinase
MTSKPWSRVAPIVQAALMHDGQARGAFVAEACGNDAELVREVESLLAHASGATDFLSTPALAMAGSVSGDRQLTVLPAEGPDEAPNDASRLAPGQRFGPYRIERLLGRGGMGEVYEAEHLEHGRRIALKVLSPGLSDAIDRARFLREGQLAAAVNHPHVVYIYGSEDIAGMPAIAMELLPGGTLKERVDREGPLTPIEAVDAMLQVVSGLEAAHEAGVLHRDVKPSNCFVDVDGTVKVGDFGLAIPSQARDVTQFVATGTFQGTPQFASPEQLRGERLDVRSDIYAAGATLYYLLTGRSPFEGRDLLALVSRIATQSPTSPREGRPEVPKALAAVVLQCLAKSPADRPAGYRVLANALEPFGSSVRTPAPLGIRTAAYLFDTFFSIVLPMNVLLGTFVVLARPSSVFGAKPVVMTLVAVSYFAITEGVWGASLGKALCGLRVVTESGAPPEFAPALLRALVFFLPAWLASGLVLSIAGLVYSMQGGSAIAAIAVQTVVQALLFVTARRAANGFAGIHERATRTRTVMRSPVGVHGLVQAARSPIDVPAGRRWVGPYRIVDTASSQPNCGAALGYDDRLRRTVWLRFPGVDADPVPNVRRILRRPARPRWLAGQRASGLAWDAYEQVPGQPFVTVVTRARSWEMVCGWLCDLAAEVQAGLRDGSLPALEVDRVWIGNNGRAWLLDFPAPNDHSDLSGSPRPTEAVDLLQAERFLYRLAVSALDGHGLVDTHPHCRTLRVPLPIAASECLAKLGEQQFTTSEDMLFALNSVARSPAAISRTKRAVHLSLCAIPAMLMLLVGALSAYYVRPGVVSTHPHVRSVNAGEPADRAGVQTDDVVVAVDGEPITFAWQLKDATAKHPGQLIALSILRDGQPLVIRATPARRADYWLLGIAIADDTPEPSLKVTWRYLWLQTFAGLMIAGTLGLVSAVAARGGIVLRLMSIAVMTRNGTLASGLRTRLRAVLSWSPVLAASAALFAGHAPLLTLTAPASLFFAVSVLTLPVFFPSEPSLLFVRVVVITVALAVFAIGLIAAVITPERGLQDRLAGTWLVPR